LTATQAALAGNALYDFPKHYFIEFSLPLTGNIITEINDTINELYPLKRHALDVFEVFFDSLPD
jgi:hypothetical protein